MGTESKKNTQKETQSQSGYNLTPKPFKLRTSNSWMDPDNYIPPKGESSVKPSKTVPDMTLTPKQLLDHHTRDVTTNYRNGIYTDTQIPIFDDLLDYAEWKQELDNAFEQTEEQLALYKEKKAILDEKAAQAEAIKDKLPPGLDPNQQILDFIKEMKDKA